jgi:hypothetical protein
LALTSRQVDVSIGDSDLPLCPQSGGSGLGRLASERFTKDSRADIQFYL